MTTTVTIGTSNNKKFSEMSQALEVQGITALRADVDVDEIKDLDPEKVIRHKTISTYKELGVPVLVDDSGIFFERYTQFPGTYSKFAFQTLGYDGLFALVKEGDRALFKTVVGYMDDTLSEPQIFSGEYPGKITSDFDWSIQSEMPYAIMFIPDDATKPMSMLTPEERKNDHRHTALNAFVEWFVTHSS